MMYEGGRAPQANFVPLKLQHARPPVESGPRVFLLSRENAAIPDPAFQRDARGPSRLFAFILTADGY